jgi:hypothetical protein
MTMDRRALFITFAATACLGGAALAGAAQPPTPAGAASVGAPQPEIGHGGNAKAASDRAPASLEQELEILRAQLKAMSEALAHPETVAASRPEKTAPPPAVAAPGKSSSETSRESMQLQLRQLRQEIQSLREAITASKPVATEPKLAPALPSEEPLAVGQPEPEQAEVEQLRREIQALEEIKKFREELSTLKQEIAAEKERIHQVQQGPAAAAPVKQFSRPPLATSLVKDEQGRVGLWINPAKWRLSTYRSNPEAVLEFANTAGNAFAFVITENLVIPPEAIANVALSNARAAAPDARVVLEDKRRVNGHEVLCLQIEGTAQQAVPFTYLGYYYSGAHGTVQVVTSTTQQAFAANQADLVDLLNGLEIYSK